MTDNMVHRVAEAMMKADWDASGEGRPEDTKIKHYYLMARAAMEAMREPTEEMGSAAAPMMGWKALGGGQLDPLAHAAEVYRAMIDAALKESQA